MRGQMIIDSYRYAAGCPPVPAGQLLEDWAGVDGYCDSTGEPGAGWLEIPTNPAVGGDFSVETTTVFQGTTAINVVGTSAAHHIRTNLWTPSGFADTNTYTFTCKVYVVSGTLADIDVALYDGTGGFVYTNNPTATGEWQTLTLANWNPASSSTFRIYLFSGNGEVIFDQMLLVQD